MKFLAWLWTRITLQPVVFGTLVRGAMMIGMAFGLKLTVDQIGMIYPWIETAIAFLTASAVTPNPTVAAKVAVALATEPPVNPQPLPETRP